jgi:hypothetical protein
MNSGKAVFQFILALSSVGANRYLLPSGWHCRQREGIFLGHRTVTVPLNRLIRRVVGDVADRGGRWADRVIWVCASFHLEPRSEG